MTVVVGWVRARGPMRAGLDETTAADIVWTLTSPEVQPHAAGTRGCDRARYEVWLRTTLEAALLLPPRGGRRGRDAVTFVVVRATLDEMTSQSTIKHVFDDVAEALRSDPALGKGTGTSVTTVSGGLRCEVVEDEWTLAVDMPTAAGGGGSAPPPGVYGRAALGSCLALTYTYWASRAGVRLDRLQVEVQADFDDGALFGTADVPAGYSEVRYVVRVQSPATEAEVVALLDEAECHSGYRDVFSRAQRCVRTVEVTASG